MVQLQHFDKHHPQQSVMGVVSIAKSGPNAMLILRINANHVDVCSMGKMEGMQLLDIMCIRWPRRAIPFCACALPYLQTVISELSFPNCHFQTIISYKILCARLISFSPTLNFFSRHVHSECLCV